MRMKKIISIACSAFLVGAGVWYFFVKENGNQYQIFVVEPGDFNQQISAAGSVVAADSVDLGFAQSGRVAHIYGKVGDDVGIGGVLGELENADLQAQLLQKKAALETTKADFVSLQEGSRPEKIAVLEATMESDKTALDQARRAIINSLHDAYTRSEDAVRNKVDQFITNARTPDADLVFLLPDTQLETALISKRAAMEKLLLEWKGQNASITVESDLSQMAEYVENNLEQVSNLLADANSALGKAVTSSSVSSASLSGWTSDVATARTTINTSISALTTVVTSQRSAAAALEKDTRSLTLEKAGASEAEIKAQAARVQSAEAEVAQAQAQLAKTIIRAPFSGVITKVDVQVGESVSIGSPLISLIGRKTLQIESHVPEIHVSFLSVGDPAEVFLDAYGADAPFYATLVSIDPAETVRDGISTYRAVLQFKDQDPRIKTGMTANITITTEQKSGVISVPQGVVHNRDGIKYVYVEKGDSLEERVVATGDVSSSGYIEIISGLSRGDRVALKLAKE